jgi:hypothetical protein
MFETIINQTFLIGRTLDYQKPFHRNPAGFKPTKQKVKRVKSNPWSSSDCSFSMHTKKQNKTH